MLPRPQEERTHHHPLRPPPHASPVRRRDRRLGQFHVGRLNNRHSCRLGKVIHDLHQERVAFLAARAVVDLDGKALDGEVGEEKEAADARFALEEQEKPEDLGAFLDTEDEMLRRRRCVLRIRTESGKSLLTFKGPVQPSSMKVREEQETVVGDGTVLLRVFEELGGFPTDVPISGCGEDGGSAAGTMFAHEGWKYSVTFSKRSSPRCTIDSTLSSVPTTKRSAISANARVAAAGSRASSLKSTPGCRASSRSASARAACCGRSCRPPRSC